MDPGTRVPYPGYPASAQTQTVPVLRYSWYNHVCDFISRECTHRYTCTMIGNLYAFASMKTCAATLDWDHVCAHYRGFRPGPS
eukprot:3407271-Rhodomonas_salina.4